MSGAIVTGNAGQFSNITGVSGVFTTQVSGAIITGDAGQFSNITGVSGVFTTRVSGAIITGNAGQFSNITGVSGVYTTVVSGATVTGNLISGGSGSFVLLSGTTVQAGTFTTTGDLYLVGASGTGVTVGRGNGSLASNVVLGTSGLNVTTGTGNIAIGDYTLTGNVGGSGNIAIGYFASSSGGGRVQTIAIGNSALTVATGIGNVAVGWLSHPGDSGIASSGARNTSIGHQSLRSNSIGSWNTVVGASGMYASNSGSGNVAIGNNTLSGLSTGSYNTALGMNAGSGTNTGGGNVAIGGMTAAGVWAPVKAFAAAENNLVVIGSTSVVSGYIQVAWTVVSDARDKTNINTVPHGLKFVNKLKPISYQFKKARDIDEPYGPVRYGFKAHEVLELEGENPVIASVTDEGNKLYMTTDYLVPVLVNAIQELTVEVDNLKANLNTSNT